MWLNRQQYGQSRHTGRSRGKLLEEEEEEEEEEERRRLLEEEEERRDRCRSRWI